MDTKPWRQVYTLAHRSLLGLPISSRNLGVSADAPSPEWTKQCYGCFLVPLPCQAAVLPTPNPLMPAPLPSPISLSLGAEEELRQGALGVVQQEESEEVLVRPVQLHFTLLPPDGGEGSVVKHQEPAAPVEHEAFQSDARVVILRPPS